MAGQPTPALLPVASCQATPTQVCAAVRLPVVVPETLPQMQNAQHAHTNTGWALHVQNLRACFRQSMMMTPIGCGKPTAHAMQPPPRRRGGAAEMLKPFVAPATLTAYTHPAAVMQCCPTRRGDMRQAKLRHATTNPTGCGDAAASVLLAALHDSNSHCGVPAYGRSQPTGRRRLTLCTGRRGSSPTLLL